MAVDSGVAAATIATDSACTVGIIGQHEIAYVQGDTWSAPTVRVQTACGVSESSTMGYLLAVDSEGRKRRFEGYLLPDYPYSLWPVADRVKDGGQYVETSDSAQVQYPDGTVSVLRREGGLWVEDVADRAEQGVAYAVGVVHSISGHPHDPNCEHCLRGRMRDKSKPGQTERSAMTGGSP